MTFQNIGPGAPQGTTTLITPLSFKVATMDLRAMCEEITKYGSLPI